MTRLLRLSFVLALGAAPVRLTAQDLPGASRTTPVFDLGELEVRADAVDSAGPVTDRRDAEALRLAERKDLAQALNLMPGVTISNVGPRNEAGVFIRGFDLRQVPLLVDGIPVYVPYDGYADLGRFTTYDVATIEVARGAVSVLTGPNALGGAINVVTRRPAAGWALDGGAGAFSGRGYETYLNAGARRGRWYGQVGGSRLRQDRFPLAGGFAPRPTQGADDRANAYRDDRRVSGKVGFLPSASSEFAIGFVAQDGEKGNPPYAGTDPAQTVRYWRWPQWDKRSVYGAGRVRAGALTVDGRVYYDRFDNQLFAFDDSSYTTQTRRSSFRSIYEDDTWGGSLQGGLPLGARLLVRGAAHYKLDTHRENNAGEPQRTSRDRTTSLGLEAAWYARPGLTVVAGVSRDDRSGLRAEDLRDGAVADLPLSSSGAWNPQLSASARVAGGTLRASVARRSRFPTIKDRYSYRLGAAIPNPDLTSEHATHLELGWRGPAARGLVLQAAAFLSRVDDLIQRVDDVARDAQDRPLFQLQNVGDARHAGFELGAEAQPLAWLRGGASYSWLDRRNLSAPEVPLLDTPKAKLFGWVAASPLPVLSAYASAEWNSSRISTTQGVGTEPFTVVDLKAIVRPSPAWSLEAGVRNLFDENYALVEGFPEPGRALLLNLRWRFAGDLP